MTSMRAVWLAAAASGTALATALDAVLLQQKKEFFTGGFLAATYLTTPLQRVGFVAFSIASDAAVIVPLTALCLVLLSRFRLRRPARYAAVTALAVAPLVIADFVAYKLSAYLGDAFDLGLLFDLTGRHLSEFLAVSSAHLGAPTLWLSAGAIAGGLVIWLLDARTTGPRERGGLSARELVVALAMCVVGSLVVVFGRAASDTYEDGVDRKPSGRAIVYAETILTDVDRDGFGIGSSLADPAPFDAAIHPYALDVPGNGIDEDGLAGDLPRGAAYTETPGSSGPWVRHPDVVLFVLESFRADAFGATVNGQPVTPTLNALAGRGVATTNAFSHNGYTAMSRFHIFSGSLAGLRRPQTLIDDFKAHGYEVGYFSGQDDSFGGPEYAVGFNRADVAYDARTDRKKRYSSFSTAGSLAVPFDVVLQRIRDFLEHRDRTRPLFLYVNYEDTHYPYSHKGLSPLVSSVHVREPEISADRAADVRAMYMNTAANVDAAIGQTIDAAAAHLSARPAVLVMADHGESLFDEGFLGHGYTLNDVQTRIPVIAAGLPIVIREPFGQSDLRDSIDAAMRADAPAGPQLVADPAKRVFQYLGTLDHPRAIAFATAHHRLIIDLRSGRVAADGTWQKPADLPPALAVEYADLVHLWERMRLARATFGGNSEVDGGMRRRTGQWLRVPLLWCVASIGALASVGRSALVMEGDVGAPDVIAMLPSHEWQPLAAAVAAARECTRWRGEREKSAGCWQSAVAQTVDCQSLSRRALVSQRERQRPLSATPWLELVARTLPCWHARGDRLAPSL